MNPGNLVMGGEARILVSREAGRESQTPQGRGCDCCPPGVEARLCETNPISKARSDRRGTGYRSCKTNPILKTTGRWVTCDAGILPAMRRRDAFDTPWPIVQNKANSGPARGLTPAQKRGYERNTGRAKQSQFPRTRATRYLCRVGCGRGLLGRETGPRVAWGFLMHVPEWL